MLSPGYTNFNLSFQMFEQAQSRGDLWSFLIG